MNPDQQRTLAEFLRSRRERRLPQDVGLPVGSRRRTPGLRREEVAALAGLSVTWYTWLEQGREAHPSRQVLHSLADILGLDTVETAHMFRLAGELPPAPDAPVTVSPAAHDEMLLEYLEPNPAFLVNRRFDIIAWNRGADMLFGGLADAGRRNIVWLTFFSDAVRAISDDWERDAAQLVGFLRAQVGERLAAPEYSGLVAEMEAGSEEFRRLWRRKDLASFASHNHAIHHPKLGLVDLEYVKFRSFDGEQTLVAYLAPKGSELACRLADLLDTEAVSSPSRAG